MVKNRFFRLLKYIRKNKISFFINVLLGELFTLTIVRYLLNKALIQRALAIETIGSFLPFISIPLILFIISYKPLVRLWMTYRRNYSFSEIPLSLVDNNIVFFFSVFIFSLFFRRDILKDIYISFSFVKCFWGLIIFLLIWFFFTYYNLGEKIKSLFSITPKKEKRKRKKRRLLELVDEPITDEDDDILGRKPFVADLYEQIRNLYSKGSFVFGLYGKWGEGKTSVLNLLGKKLKEDERIILLNSESEDNFGFNPWEFENEKSMLRSFYESLRRSITGMSHDLTNVLSKYQKILGIKNIGFSLFGLNINWDFIKSDVTTLRKTKDEIENYINNTGKKLVIFIDDIDRIPPDWMLLVFKLVKLSAHFRNTIFILSFNKDVVQKQLSNEFKIEPDFLDKIVQKEVYLPLIEQFDIDNFIGIHIDEIFREIEAGKKDIEIFEKDFPYLYQTQIRKLFPTLRHVKKYLNGLRSTIPSIKDEVNLQDFMIIELIRFFYPNVYMDIWTNPWYYIPSWSDETYLSSLHKFGLKEDQKYSQIKQHIEELIKEEENSDVLLALLQTIFFVEVKNAFNLGKTSYDKPSSSVYRREKRITHPDCFKKYFMLKVPSRELSDKMVESIIDLWNNLEKKQLSEKLKETCVAFQKEGKLLELFDKLLIFSNKLVPKAAKPIIRGLIENVRMFSKVGRENFWRSECDRAHSLILHLINDRIRKDEIQSMLEEIIKNVNSNEFAVSIILSCMKERGGNLYRIYDNIDIDKLKGIVSERLTNYFVEGKKDIFKEEEDDDRSYILYQWGNFSEDDKKKVNNYVFMLIDENPEYLGKLISGFSTKESKREKRLRYDTLTNLYKAEELYKRIKQGKKIFSNNDESKAIDLFVRIFNEKK